MSKPKLSPWFNAREHKPVRPGWYEVNTEGWGFPADLEKQPRMRWDGRRWRGNALGGFGTFIGDQWRGLLK